MSGGDPPRAGLANTEMVAFPWHMLEQIAPPHQHVALAEVYESWQSVASEFDGVRMNVHSEAQVLHK
jgi:hypothetical protein